MTKTPLTTTLPPGFPTRRILVKHGDGLGARTLEFLRASRFARKLGAGLRRYWRPLSKTPLPPGFPSRSILLKRGDGLGARTLAFLRAWRFARKLGAGLRLYWRPLDHRRRDQWWYGDEGYSEGTCDGEGLEVLLDLEAMRNAGFLDDLVVRDLSSAPDCDACLEKLPIFSNGIRHGFAAGEVFANGPLIETGAQRSYRVVGETSGAVHDELVALFDSLIIHPAIQVLRDEFRASIGGRPFAVIHIRRGDVLVDTVAYVRKRAAGIDPAEAEAARSRVGTFLLRCPPTWTLLAETNRLAPDLPILTMGDSLERITELRSWIGEDRLVAFPAGRAELSSVQRAFLDLVLIREAAVVVGGRSAFVTFPTEMGHGRLFTVLPDGDQDAWFATFEKEVLDAAGVPDGARGLWREVFGEAWDHYSPSKADERRSLRSDLSSAPPPAKSGSAC